MARSSADRVASPSPPPTRTPERDPQPADSGYALGQNVPANVVCQPGDGRRTAGGGEEVSHKGWPAITGVF
jgi:hypothetical protein